MANMIQTVRIKNNFRKINSFAAGSAFVLFCFTGFSQTGTNFSLEQFERNVMAEKAHRMNQGMTYDDISGSPYFSDEFTEGEVKMPDGNTYQGVMLRYDIYSDRIEFKDKKGQVLEILEPERYDRFLLGGKTFRYVLYEAGNKTGKSYMQMLGGGKLTLYKKLRIDFKDAQKPQAYKEAEPAQFIAMPADYYLSVDSGQAKKIKSQKETIDLLRSVKPDLTNYVKKEKLNLNKEDDLLRAVEYCNQ